MLDRVKDEENFEREVRALCATNETRAVQRRAVYRPSPLVWSISIVPGLVCLLFAAVPLVVLGPHPLLFVFMLPFLLPGIGYGVSGVLIMRNVRVERDETLITVYDALGRKRGGFELGDGLEVKMTRFSNAEFTRGSQRIRMTANHISNKKLYYDAFAIAEGNYEFVDSDSPLLSQ